jgi:cytochrome c-type biogenesis protein CcmF
MNSLGHFALFLAWTSSLLGFFTGIYSGKREKRSWFYATRNLTIAVGVFTGIATVALAILFVSNDYTNQYVWQFSNRTMPTIYKISAIWGGMDGSMLLWACILSLSGAIVGYSSAHGPRLLMPWVLAIVNSSSLFFLTVTLYLSNPFRHIKAPFIPPDGNGLNPLLQNPFMAIHPPTLYAGFTTFAIPYAFCLGAVLAGQLSNEWIRLTRRWTLIAWGFLTAGIVLGGFWAYIELGWGGFWAWDPVENSSFLPWLTGTAFLHSVMVQERKNMLRFWNVWLVVITYGLTVFGTFLTRSGVVQSVHAFASTDIGWIFLVYLGLIIFATAVATFIRRDALRSERRIESLFSREAAFLLNNLIFLSICFATLWGVLFPVLSEAVTGTKQTIGIPFFNAVNVPLFLILIFLMAVGPLIAWRKASLTSLRKTFLSPFVTSLAVGIVLALAGIESFYAVLAYALSFFVFLTIMGELYRAARAQRLALSDQSLAQSVTTVLRRHQSRYGGYLVHLGVAVCTIAITASMAHKVERDFALAQGESFEVGAFRLVLKGLEEYQDDNYQALRAIVSVEQRASGAVLQLLQPEMRVYNRNKETTNEVAIRTGPLQDVYLVLAGLDESGTKAAMKVFINPLQIWLWIGAIVMVIGTIVVLRPSRRALATTVAESDIAHAIHRS